MANSNTDTTADGEFTGSTVVITHRIRDDKHDEYEAWLAEISPLARAMPGCLDWHIVRPIRNISDTYTIILRYDTLEHLKAWMESPTRSRLVEKAMPLLTAGDDFYISSGLDFWFTPSGAKTQIPVRWKQFIITWSAIYPLSLSLQTICAPIFQKLDIHNHFLTTFFITGIVVFMMVYIVMPRYTKLVRHWLFTSATTNK